MYQRKLSKMDLDKQLRHANNLNDYISVTQEMAKHEFKGSKVQFNMSTVLLLKKVKSWEIEYFNKCEGNGAALVLFERMVEQPPSKTWGLLGKELVLLLQYWLDAIRKHLIKHNQHWWTFLKLLLKFIKTIRTKDRSLPDILVENTTECLLDLATSSQPDILQRLKILSCLNLCCAESSREIRFALKNKFENYFGKLSSLLVTCGHLPGQYSMLETLLRWLLPRQAAAVRRAAAAQWFPEVECGRPALDVFLERPWQDFFQDARDFLNACNEHGDLVTSAVCRKLTVGSVAVVTGTEKRLTWLDINSLSKSVSIVLDVRLLDALGVEEVTSWETLVIPQEDVISVRLFREASEVLLSIRTSRAPRLCPSGHRLPGCELAAALAAACPRLHRAATRAFHDRYQVLLDLDSLTSLSPHERKDTSKKTQVTTDEDTRFSHPVEVRRRKHSGFIVRPRHPVAWPSPSTASTTSLAQLHEKLEALPQYKFDKEAVHVCALPELSTVTEVSETDDRQSVLSSQTLKINRPYGVCHKNFKTSDKNSQSDGEVQSKRNTNRCLSPIVNEAEETNNCLLVATIGSADESIISDTLERLTKNKDFRSDNIVNLLVQEALQRDLNDKEFLDSGINTGDVTKKTQNVDEVNSEAIENTPLEKRNTKVISKKEADKSCTVISNTTTDESNDVVFETPKNFVTLRRRNTKSKLVKDKDVVLEETDDRQVFDEKAVEEFFSQHIIENKRGEIVISPTLARKINETSSESEQFEDCLMIHEDIVKPEDNNINVEQIDLHDIEIVECLNSMVDKVCSEFEKCAEFLNRETKEMDRVEVNDDVAIYQIEANENMAKENPPDVIPFTDVSNIQNITTKPDKNIPKKGIKLTYTAKKPTKTTRTRNAMKNNHKLVLERAPHMSPIKEKSSDDAQDNNTTPESNKNKVQSPKTDSPTSKSGDTDTTLIRRKRKLYSPKYETVDSDKTGIDNDDDNNNFKATKLYTPKYKATCYKDIETDRKKRIRQPRERKSRSKSETPSPRTKKRNDMFDKLKEKLECPVTVVTAAKKAEKDMAIYNFTSDSEDEDFKKKKIEVQKRISSTTIASGDSGMSTRKGRRIVNRINYSENKSSDETITKTTTRPKRTVRRKRTRLEKPVKGLVDEKMRKATTDELNTSIIVTEDCVNISEEPQLVLAVNPAMEAIPDEVEIKDISEKQKKSNRKSKKAEVLSLKKEKNISSKINIEKDNDDRTISPLPGLVIEAMPCNDEDANDSVSLNMLQKLKQIQEAGTEEFINETNTTQNLLSDVERVNCSPIQMNITDELNKYANDDSKSVNENTKSSSKSHKIKNKQDGKDDSEKIRDLNEMAKTKRRLRSKSPVMINLSDSKSEKSIATVGKSPITAHGDSDEAPPHTDLLSENLKPRDLDIEHLDKSMKEYFYKLRNEIEVMPREGEKSKDSTSTKIIPDRDDSVNKSPVVSIKRLSFDDISKWLPSPRNSETESRCSDKSRREIVVTKEKLTKRMNEDIFEGDLYPTNSSSARKDKSQHLDNTEVRRSKRPKSKPVILQYAPNEDKSPKNSGFDTSRNNSSSIKWLRSHGDVEPETNYDKNVDVTKNSGNNSSFYDKAKKSRKPNDMQGNRKSTISPIKFFDEIGSNEKSFLGEDSPILRSKSSSTRPESTINRKESSIIRQQSIMRQELITIRQQSSSEEDNPVEGISKLISNKKLQFEQREKKTIRATVDTIPVPEMRNEREVSRRKRKSDSPEISFPKKRKQEDLVTISESGPSVSSVNEWFRRNGPPSRAESIDTSFRDSIQSVMEKLDTTLAEIHQNTSKSFIHLFVDAQSKLGEMRRERRSMLKAAASEILAQVVSVIDDKFADLDRRSQNMQDSFAEQLKAQASALLREDCARKQAMVSLLREDLHATLARIEKRRDVE